MKKILGAIGIHRKGKKGFEIIKPIPCYKLAFLPCDLDWIYWEVL